MVGILQPSLPCLEHYMKYIKCSYQRKPENDRFCLFFNKTGVKLEKVVIRLPRLLATESQRDTLIVKLNYWINFEKKTDLLF